jgi:hypothetical protein
VGAFIGYDQVGVWANNRERDAFLDWFADNRCSPHDERWEYCKSPAHRYMGFCVDLEDLLPRGEQLTFTPDEYSRAANHYWPDVAQLLGIIDAITRGEWLIENGNIAAENWRRGDGPERETYKRLGLLD